MITKKKISLRIVFTDQGKKIQGREKKINIEKKLLKRICRNFVKAVNP